MAKLTLGALQRDMPTSLDVSTWNVANTATSGTASDPGRVGSPMPGFRTDRIDFTGYNLAFDGVAKARGIIDTMRYQSYGGLGYYEQYKFEGLKVTYQDVVTNKADIMSLLLNGNDTVLGNGLANTLYGFDGNDTIDGGAGTDQLVGGKGNDTLTGGAGADRLDGGADTDTVSYAASAAAVSANLLTGKASGGDAKGDVFVSIENLTGSKFNDTLVGNSGVNTLSGLAGNDWLDGGKGNDKLIGGAGDDTLIGGAGNDHIYAGAGQDKVWLGDGSDVFHLAPKDQTATIYDFDVAADRIDVSGFSQISAQNYQSFLHDTADGTVLDLGNGDRVVLVGVDVADLGLSDFLF